MVADGGSFSERSGEGAAEQQAPVGFAGLSTGFCFVFLRFSQERAVTESQHGHIQEIKFILSSCERHLPFSPHTRPREAPGRPLGKGVWIPII